MSERTAAAGCWMPEGVECAAVVLAAASPDAGRVVSDRPGPPTLRSALEEHARGRGITAFPRHSIPVVTFDELVEGTRAPERVTQFP